MGIYTVFIPSLPAGRDATVTDATVPDETDTPPTPPSGDAGVLPVRPFPSAHRNFLNNLRKL